MYQAICQLGISHLQQYPQIMISSGTVLEHSSLVVFEKLHCWCGLSDTTNLVVETSFQFRGSWLLLLFERCQVI
jgi:hypothetical protein